MLWVFFGVPKGLILPSNHGFLVLKSKEFHVWFLKSFMFGFPSHLCLKTQPALQPAKTMAHGTVWAEAFQNCP